MKTSDVQDFLTAAMAFAKSHIENDAMDEREDDGEPVSDAEWERMTNEYNATKAELKAAYRQMMGLPCATIKVVPPQKDSDRIALERDMQRAVLALANAGAA